MKKLALRNISRAMEHLIIMFFAFMIGRFGGDLFIERTENYDTNAILFYSSAIIYFINSIIIKFTNR